MSVRLYVGNLPKEPIERQALQDMFADVGESVTTKLIKDRKTGKCRGFAFVTVPNDEMADAFIAKYNGQAFMENPLKIEKALPRSKGKAKDESKSQSQSRSDSESASASFSGRRGGSKRARSRDTHNSSSSSVSESIQPDPRWADQLAQLKEMLAAQTTKS